MTQGEENIPLDIQLARRVAALRRAARLSQKELGTALGVSARQVQRYEAGQKLSAATLYRICRCLELPIESAFDGVADPTPAVPAREPRSRSDSPRGFAAMSAERLRSISAKGGSSVSANRRSFAQDVELARSAGRVGGRMKRSDN